MVQNLIVWLTGTVTGSSGYPRKNAEVRGVLYDADRRVAAATTHSDYSGQYCLAIEVDAGEEISSSSDELRVALAAEASGDFEEHASDVVWLDGKLDLIREIQLEKTPDDSAEQPLRAAA